MRVACVFFIQKENFELSDFAEACLSLSPQIAIREPDVIFIEIQKCRALYSEDSFRVRMEVLLRRFHAKAHLSISDDIPTSLSRVHYGVKSKDQLPVETLEIFGDPFRVDPVGQKAIGKMIEALKQLGIRTLGEFKLIPTSHIPSRFGRLGLYCKQSLEEASSIPWPYWKIPHRYLERIELTHLESCSEVESLLFKAKEILNRLFSRLRGRGLRAERIRFSVELEKYSTVRQPIREWVFELIYPQGSVTGFLPILRERLALDLSRAPMESDVVAMSCEILSTTSGWSGQKKMLNSYEFDASCEDFQEAMGSLFGQLEEFLGKGKVFWAKITEDRWPERSWIKTVKQNEVHADCLGRYPQRPTRIFKVPIPITLLENRVIFMSRCFKTLHWSRVERLSLDWVDDVPARNYYRVDLEGGLSLWIFSDRRSVSDSAIEGEKVCRFFVHGHFE